MNIIESVKNNYCKNCKYSVKFQGNCKDCSALVIGPLRGGCILDVFKYYIVDSENNK
ncbi:hypothetical protein [Clostridium perfringens]|uniref:hypothetical protein n=1 Tax=Clostridium perfringens TaxID=1502 RepID=UPI00214D4ACF|nr:hypothetical protein [Clostridium perfringens]MDM0804697.1 hypothetical protein [Clostridium perfringens]MDM0927125.1 hypothetical protein [Clostridium perfringens]UUW67488.1 hypothetical protein NQ197_15200 [Clostridium perfringens]